MDYRVHVHMANGDEIVSSRAECDPGEFNGIAEVYYDQLGNDDKLHLPTDYGIAAIREAQISHIHLRRY